MMRSKRVQNLRKEYENNPIAKQIVDTGRVIEGMVTKCGHACRRSYYCRPSASRNLVPLTTQDGILTTQYPKDPVEELGLLKMDFLGLKTLTVISEAESHIRRKEGLSDFRVTEAPLEDEPTFKLLERSPDDWSISIGIGWHAPALQANDHFQCR